MTQIQPNQLNTLHERLAKIQQDLKVQKSNFNAFGKYKFRNCEDILEAVKPHLNGLTLILSDEIVQVGDRYYIKATATLSDGKEAINNSAYAREPQEVKGMAEAQVTGASSSYARKYSLNGLLALDDTKDADSADNTKIEEYSLDQASIEKINQSQSLEGLAIVCKDLTKAKGDKYRKSIVDQYTRRKGELEGH